MLSSFLSCFYKSQVIRPHSLFFSSSNQSWKKILQTSQRVRSSHKTTKSDICASKQVLGHTKLISCFWSAWGSICYMHDLHNQMDRIVKHWLWLHWFHLSDYVTLLLDPHTDQKQEIINLCGLSAYLHGGLSLSSSSLGSEAAELGGLGPPPQFLPVACGRFAQIIGFFAASHASPPIIFMFYRHCTEVTQHFKEER